MHESEKSRRNYRKICLHPKQHECSKQKIHAHTISQKAVLDLIAQNGQVLMPIMYGVDSEFKMKSLGIEADATKLYCFCAKHDAIFYPIDTRNVSINNETIFLYAYRAFAGTYYKVLREEGIYQKLSNKSISPKHHTLFLRTKSKNCGSANLMSAERFLTLLFSPKKYDIFKTHIIELPYRVLFAASSCFPVIFDIYGNQIKTTADKMQSSYLGYSG